MIYQKILTSETPYLSFMGKLGQFPEHRHADIELQYCLSGTLEIMIDKQLYQMHEGDIALICPMSSHAIPTVYEGEQNVLTAIVGAAFLKRHFAFFSNLRLPSPIINIGAEGEVEQQIRLQFEKLAELYRENAPPNDLLVTGVLYHICAYLQELLLKRHAVIEHANRQMSRVGNIEKALELIYYHYADPIRVEDAALETGYGKSNFCKIFRATFGSTFHQALNQQRVQSACILLNETDMSVAEIAQEVGLPECKSFCRVFKSIMNTTPGQYRKKREESSDIFCRENED